MKMKNIIVALSLLFAVTTFAQNKKTSEIPANSKQFLSEQFPQHTISSVRDNDANRIKGFTVTLSNNTEIEFRKDGHWKEVDGNGKEIPTALVVQPILDYVTKNYPKEKITKIEYSLSKIEIDLTNKIDLQFDKDGKFIKID